jgi:hypothetical protein
VESSLKLHNNSCTVVIVGVFPGILLHNPAGMGTNKSAKKVIPSPEDEAAASAYWTEDRSSLALPSFNLYRGLVEASSGCKLPGDRKRPLGPVVAGDLSIEPYMIPFNALDYRVDMRRVVIQRQGIVRARACLPEWGLTFQVLWEAQLLGTDFHKNVLPDLLERLGKSIGVGDFRPGKSKGPFGRFLVESIV